MPYKGSRTIHKKNSMLDQFHGNKKLWNNMKIKITELEKELKDKQLEFNVKVDNKKTKKAFLMIFSLQKIMLLLQSEKRKENQFLVFQHA